MKPAHGIKMLAVVIAVILWVYVRVTVGGVTQNVITQLELRIPLETRGGETNMIPFEKSTDTIRLTLRGDSDVVTELREGLVRAYVDLEGMAPGSNWPEVQVLVPAGVQILEIDPGSVNVRLSPLMVKDVPVVIETEGKPRSGFKAGRPIFTPDIVRIEGPEELVRQVSVVSGSIPLAGLTDSIAITVNNLVPLNDNGTTVMGSDSAIRLGTKEVRATVPIEHEVTVDTLPVLLENLKVKKQPGYVYLDLDVSPEFVQVSSSLPRDELPNGIQVAPFMMEPKGTEVLTVNVPLKPTSDISLVGTSHVTLTLRPRRANAKQ